MTTLADLFDVELLDDMITDGFVRRFEHDNGDLVGLHYAERAQWDRVWNPVTLNCRGIIADTAGNVIARPFPKFFNLGDQPEEDAKYADRRPVLWEKLDGSLGIHYRWAGDNFVATKGSFHSPQAEWATDWWRTHIDAAPPEGHSDLFEIIYPANRVVVDYGERSELVHLARLRNSDAARIATAGPRGVTVAQVVATHTPVGEARAMMAPVDDGNTEGLVAEWSDGRRVKIKLDEYLRLHRVMSSTSTKTVWEALAAGTGIAAMLDATPDEFQTWVCDTAERLQNAHDLIAEAARYWFDRLNTGGARAEFAERAKSHDWPSLMFALYDGKSIEERVWRMVQPESAEYPPVGPAAATKDLDS